MSDEEFRSFEEFWPFYVEQHSKPATRALHFVGTTAAIACALGGPLIALAPFCGYGPAWVSHFFIEKNRPATFKHPLWSLRADFRMFRLTLLGRMERELARAREQYPPRAAASDQPSAISR